MPQMHNPSRDTFAAIATQTGREAGITHLLHFTKLAQARLRPSRSDGMFEVGTMERGNPYLYASAATSDPRALEPGADMLHVHLRSNCDEARKQAYRERSAAALLEKRQRWHRTVNSGNQTLLCHLVEAEDDASRRRRHMAQFPSSQEEEETLWGPLRLWEEGNAEQRRRSKKMISGANRELLKALISAGPAVQSAKKLGHWYNKIHKKRLKQLSRFKVSCSRKMYQTAATCTPSEPFAGASILELDCGVRVPSKWPHSSQSTWAPLITGTYVHCSTSRDLLHSFSKRPSQLNDGGSVSWGTSKTAREKPGWRDPARTDIPMMNYEKDVLMVLHPGATSGGADSGVLKGAKVASKAWCGKENNDIFEHNAITRVRRAEEGGCTALWRKAVCRSKERQQRQLGEYTKSLQRSERNGRASSCRTPRSASGTDWACKEGDFVTAPPVAKTARDVASARRSQQPPPPRLSSFSGGDTTADCGTCGGSRSQMPASAAQLLPQPPPPPCSLAAERDRCLTGLLSLAPAGTGRLRTSASGNDRTLRGNNEKREATKESAIAQPDASSGSKMTQPRARRQSASLGNVEDVLDTNSRCSPMATSHGTPLRATEHSHLPMEGGGDLIAVAPPTSVAAKSGRTTPALPGLSRALRQTQGSAKRMTDPPQEPRGSAQRTGTSTALTDLSAKRESRVFRGELPFLVV